MYEQCLAGLQGRRARLAARFSEPLWPAFVGLPHAYFAQIAKQSDHRAVWRERECISIASYGIHFCIQIMPSDRALHVWHATNGDKAVSGESKGYRMNKALSTRTNLAHPPSSCKDL